jgi:hypothetical protein
MPVDVIPNGGTTPATVPTWEEFSDLLARVKKLEEEKYAHSAAHSEPTPSQQNPKNPS